MINISVLQDMNPWWQGKVTEAQKFRRMEFDNIFKSLEKMEVTAIIGARRIGKTTLIKQAIVEILKKTESKNILFINADDVRLEITSYKELEEIIEYYFSNILSKEKSELDKKVYVFIDEAQYVKGWRGLLKSYYDLGFNIKFIVSGSSSLDILIGASESLVGRLSFYKLYPCSFLDILRFNGINNIDIISIDGVKEVYEKLVQLSNTIKIEKFHLLLNRYITIGGYPQFLAEHDYTRISQDIQEILSLVVSKDFVKLFHITNIEEINKLLIVLASQIGNHSSINSISKNLSLDNKTVQKYISYLKEAFMIIEVKQYSKSGVKKLRKNKKFYFWDTGILNTLNAFLNENLIVNNDYLGKVAEQLVIAHCRKFGEIYYYKNKFEIDIIYKETAIEVKYRNEIPFSQINLLKEFIHKNNLKFCFIVSKNRLSLEDNILIIPLYLFFRFSLI